MKIVKLDNMIMTLPHTLKMDTVISKMVSLRGLFVTAISVDGQTWMPT